MGTGFYQSGKHEAQHCKIEEKGIRTCQARIKTKTTILNSDRNGKEKATVKQHRNTTCFKSNEK